MLVDLQSLLSLSEYSIAFQFKCIDEFSSLANITRAGGIFHQFLFFLRSIFFHLKV